MRGETERVRRICRQVLFLLLAVCVPAMGAPDSDTKASGGIAVSRAEDSGMLRVYLKSLGNPHTLDIAFAGVYTLEGKEFFNFGRGAEIVLSEENGKVLLVAGGITLDLGKNATFVRCADESDAESGLRIAQAAKPNLYCGDLTVSAEGQGLRPVLKIQIEDYLCGVVAYEMSNAFPLEALKAQAVAARSYAMRRRQAAGSCDYDVVDTTEDQVFRGLDTAHKNVIRAVRETCGIVGVCGGAFAICYYTASNGGQTALPSDIWSGRGNEGHLDTRNDPYDLENPLSLVNSLVFSEDLSDSPGLKALLEQKLTETMTADRSASARIDAVTSVKPVDPLRPGSRMYRKLRFELEVSLREYGWVCRETGEIVKSGSHLEGILTGARAALKDAEHFPFERMQTGWRKRPGTVAVELSVYEDVKDGLALGLSNPDCELVSVSEMISFAGDTIYTVEMRRFGHGVGMSQRGAQQMAGQYAMEYPEILAFYYPGMSLEQIVWVERQTAAPRGPVIAGETADPETAEEDAAKTDAEGRRASIKLERDSSVLNVRGAPSTGARILGRLQNGCIVAVLEERADGWARIRTAETEGFVRTEYLVKD